jgi:hypothetical protein
MQLALRPHAIVGVAVLGAGLISVTPMTTPHIERHTVNLVAAEDIIDVLNPVDAGFSTVMGAGDSALTSVSDALPAAADLQLLDPAFWELFWFELTDPDAGSAAELLLVGAIEQLPVIGPLMVGFGGALFLGFLLLADAWSVISQALGFEPYGVDAALAGVIDPALPAGVSTTLADLTPLFSDAAAVLDPSAVTSILDLSPISDVGTGIDPAVIADIGTVLSTTSIPDLGEVLTTLIP